MSEGDKNRKNIKSQVNQYFCRYVRVDFINLVSIILLLF
jgi:hypothetical protein